MGVAPLDVGVVADAEGVSSPRLNDLSLLSEPDAVLVFGGGALVC